MLYKTSFLIVLLYIYFISYLILSNLVCAKMCKLFTNLICQPNNQNKLEIAKNIQFHTCTLLSYLIESYDDKPKMD